MRIGAPTASVTPASRVRLPRSKMLPPSAGAWSARMVAAPSVPILASVMAAVPSSREASVTIASNTACRSVPRAASFASRRSTASCSASRASSARSGESSTSRTSRPPATTRGTRRHAPASAAREGRRSRRSAARERRYRPSRCPSIPATCKRPSISEASGCQPGRGCRLTTRTCVPAAGSRGSSFLRRSG